MLLLMYLWLLGGALAHYHIYDERNLIERDEPLTIDGNTLVECPVCEEFESYLGIKEECPIVLRGKTYKVCRHGVYRNDKCGNRLDCYRGPDESCTEKKVQDDYGQRCMSGYWCNPEEWTCKGLNTKQLDSTLLMYISNLKYPPKSADMKPSDRFQYGEPIRAKRQS